MRELFGDETTSGSRQVTIVLLESSGTTSRVEGRMYGTGVNFEKQDQEVRLEEISRAQQRVIDALERTCTDQVEVRHRYSHFPMLALEINEEHLEVLGGLPEVVSVMADQRGEAELASSLPFIGASDLQVDGIGGAGTTVALLDAPVRYWETDFFGSCPAQGEWSPDTPGCSVTVWEDTTSPPVDIEDLATRTPHGTTVAGIVRGVAPETSLLSLNVFRWDSGAAFFMMSDVIAGLDRVAELSADHEIVAVNLSLGGNWPAPFPCDSLEIIPASWPASVTGLFPTAYYEPIRILWEDLGIPVVAATGNGASSSHIKSPACTTLAISAAASFDSELDNLPCAGWVQSDPHVGEVACFSNINRTVDIVAPGVWIDAAGEARTYGTSMAAPHVSGAIALLQSSWADSLGHHLEPHWVHRRLLLAGVPIDHNGVVQRSLNVSRGVDELFADVAFSFAGYILADSAGVIPTSPSTLTETFEVSGTSLTVDTALLYLEVLHPQPEDVEVTLEAPGSSSVSLNLTAGGPNFNAIIGRDLLVGAFDTFTESDADGTWTLTLTDQGGSGQGYYIGATVFVYDSTCTPQCEVRACGDDGCGGACGGCDDLELCTTDGQCASCDPACGSRSCGDDRCGGSCGGCDDSLFCNGWEECVSGSCVDGMEPCLEADSLTCTRDCDETTRSCNAPLEGYCIIDETCIDLGSLNPNNPCEECLPSIAVLEWSPDDSNTCDDGDACTAVDSCLESVCVGGEPPHCDDDDPCTDDSCDSLEGCQWEFNTAPCDDGDACTDDDICGGGVCISGAEVECDDDNLCTDDACDIATGCVFLPNSELCDDGSACTVDDFCSEGSCSGEEVDCDDGDACTLDSCDHEVGCAYSAVDCDDLDDCTIDSCDAGSGCEYSPVDCDDHDACTEDTCNPQGGCEYISIDCDDGNDCTDDRCDAASGCVNESNTLPCEDGNLCTSDDVCSEGSCEPGVDVCNVEDEGCTCSAVVVRGSSGALLMRALDLVGVVTKR